MLSYLQKKLKEVLSKFTKLVKLKHFSHLLRKIASTEWFFYVFEMFIIAGMGYFIFISKSKENLSFAELLFTIGYAMLVRKKIRPILAARWNYFNEKPSAPYTLTFMGLLMICAFLLIFRLEPIAEQLANIAYFMLVIAVGIEFSKMLKEKDDVDQNLERKEVNK